MPVITIECGTMGSDAKARLIQELTAAASKVTNISAQAFTIVIHENSPENIGVGGKVLKDIL